MNIPKVSLDQWQILLAVHDAGSFQAAADSLHRSQSSVSYAISQLQDKLGVTLFEYRGRRAQLTERGQMVVRRARQLVQQANLLEQATTDLAQGWEPEIGVVLDVIFPRDILVRALERFAPDSHGARIEIFTEVLSGTQDKIVRREVNLGLCGIMPTGFLGEPLCEVEMLAVASPDHPLQELSDITEDQLAQHRQLVIRDSGSYRRLDRGWLGSEQRWTVSDFRDALDYLLEGLGFAFVPRHMIVESLQTGRLHPLPLAHGASRNLVTNLVYADKEAAGPGTRALAALIKEEARRFKV